MTRKYVYVRHWDKVVPIERVRKICAYCGCEFWVPKSREKTAKFCSAECQHKGREITEVYIPQLKKSVKVWTKEEMDLLIKLYATAKRDEILKAFPNRSWNAIVIRANFLGLKRPKELKFGEGWRKKIRRKLKGRKCTWKDKISKTVRKRKQFFIDCNKEHYHSVVSIASKLQGKYDRVIPIDVGITADIIGIDFKQKKVVQIEISRSKRQLREKVKAPWADELIKMEVHNLS